MRAFGAVGGTPIFFERANGAYLHDVDGRSYVDFVCSWGAVIAGHAHERIVHAVRTTLDCGTSFGAPCRGEVELAERIREAMPALERVRMVSSGTEAVMTAVRLARAHTAREKVIKLRGCYHGHADAMLVRAGSGVATLGLPDSPGVTRGATADTLVADYNDLASVRALLESHPDEVAALIVEPVAGNMGLVLPDETFLPGLRALADEHGALLVFDEVMTGFRVGPGGAQARFGVRPDLTTLGKVIGGGLPVGAVGGPEEIMSLLAPLGPVYQAGTLSGNPLAMSAGLAALDCLADAGAWERLEQATARVVETLREEAERATVPLRAASLGAMFGFFFSDEPVRSWVDAERTDRARFARFFHAMLNEGVYLAPSPFEAGFVSMAHGGPELERFAVATRAAMAVA